MITVSTTGGDFKTIGDALKQSDDDTVYIKSGIYSERVVILRPHMTLIGESREDTVITGGLYAKMQHSDGKLGTFRSYTMLINADDVSLKDLTIENTAGSGESIGQAVALYAEGDGLLIENCNIKGHQDTLFTGPLPPFEIEKDGFRGPTEFSERIQGRQQYKNCYIEGDVDFIFGSAEAYFDSCRIHSLDRGQDINGYITAPSTPEGSARGYTFTGCIFTGECRENSVYTGRPWREYAKCSFIGCRFGKHIRRELVHDWNKPAAHLYSNYSFTDCIFENPPADIPDLVKICYN